MKPCSICGDTKPLGDFYKHPRTPDKLDHRCKACAIEYAKKWMYADADRILENGIRVNRRRFSKKHPKSVVSWANNFFIDEAHRLARLRTKVTGIKWSVDHIVPLKSNLVCGLHTHVNIQVIPYSENSRKSNRVWPDMPERA